jgi:hypothetical protein
MISRGSIGGLGIASLIFGQDVVEDRAGATQHDGDYATAYKVHLKDDGILEINDGEVELSLYENAELEAFVSQLAAPIALDITGLEHRVWAPLVRALLSHKSEVVALYAEPDDYQKSSEPLPGEIYDLSSQISGIEPLPGFARVSIRDNDLGYFAPLLGFEGARLAYVMDQEDVDIRNTFPVVGAPGFRLEYPAFTYLANRDVLTNDYLHRRVELARASCPFEAYAALERVLGRADGSYLRIAPLGTKPHALGAVLFAITHPDSVELVYDHPVRLPGRTSGTRSIHVYEVSAFLAQVGQPS